MKMLKKSYKYIILVFSVLLMVIGYFRGENLVILRKAVRICLECIGVG